jgi:hypothetical protein
VSFELNSVKKERAIRPFMFIIYIYYSCGKFYKLACKDV